MKKPILDSRQAGLLHRIIRDMQQINARPARTVFQCGPDWHARVHVKATGEIDIRLIGADQKLIARSRFDSLDRFAAAYGEVA